jgi:hypothetical protein
MRKFCRLKNVDKKNQEIENSKHTACINLMINIMVRFRVKIMGQDLVIRNKFSNQRDNILFGFLLGVVGQFSQLKIAPQVDIKVNVISKFWEIIKNSD